MKAFDMVSRDFFTTVRQFHGMMVRVMVDGQESRTFPVTKGVKQGCVLAPMLFSIMFTALLSDPFCGSQSGIQLRYKTDGKLFNLHRKG